jgi:hypothetical protein
MMKIRLRVLLLCAGLTGGCTHTHEVGHELPQTPPEKMLRSLTGENVTVTMRDSEQLEGTVIAGRLDTMQLLAKGAHSSVSLPLNMIADISTPGSAWGPIVGLIGGGVAGGFIGGSIGKSASESGGFGAVDENTGALIGGLAGAVVGVLVGAHMTAADVYKMPLGGIRISKPADTVTVEVSRILEETEFSITIPWYGKTTTLPKSRISIVRRTGEILIRVPRSLLYGDDGPRYIDSHE